MSKLFLVTGANGFVGKQVVKKLLEKDCRVRVVIRSKNNLSELYSLFESVIFTKDIFQETEEWWKKTLVGVDTVIHLAWHVEPKTYLYSLKNTDCSIGTLRLAKSITQSGVKRFIGIGTCLEYQLKSEPLTVNSLLAPETPYAAAKLSTYWGVKEMLHHAGVDFAWCRLFYLYGEGEHPDRLVPYLHKQLSAGEPALLGNGNQIRDFLNVVEAAQQIVKVAEGELLGVFNICSGVPITIKEFSEKIVKDYKRNELLRFGARLSNSKGPAYVVGVPTSD